MSTSRLTPAERTLRARAAAHTMHAGTGNDKMAAARREFINRFEREADPDGVLDPEERARRADHLLKAHMARLALASVQARRKAAAPPGDAA